MRVDPHASLDARLEADQVSCGDAEYVLAIGYREGDVRQQVVVDRWQVRAKLAERALRGSGYVRDRERCAIEESVGLPKIVL